MFYQAEPAFQFLDPFVFYVHHLSEYEHRYTRRKGPLEALQQTKVLSKSVYKGECRNITSSTFTSSMIRRQSIVVIPFVGAKGKGNSHMDVESKLFQLTATLCSTSIYFSEFIIGVARRKDQEKLVAFLTRHKPMLLEHIHIVHFNITTSLGALPYQLLTWTQTYIYQHNCRNYSSTNADDVNDVRYICSRGHKQTYAHIHQPLHVMSYEDFTIKLRERRTSDAEDNAYRYVYFTESDQLLYFDSTESYQAACGLANATSFVAARRREKNSYSSPISYHLGLNTGRDCGAMGYELNWPLSNLVTQSSLENVILIRDNLKEIFPRYDSHTVEV